MRTIIACSILADAYNYDETEQLRRVQDALTTMRPDQKEAYDKITKAIDANNAAIFYIDGPGGSGKTFLEKTLLAYVRSKGQIALKDQSQYLQRMQL